MSFQTEANELRRKLDEQPDIITTMLSLCNLTLTAESQKSPARVHTPQVLGIYPTDLLDENVFVPVQHCGSQISWAEIAKPGMPLVMSALVKVSARSAKNDVASAKGESNEIQCLYCRTIFRVFDDRFEEIEDQSAQNNSLTTGSNSSAHSEAGTNRSSRPQTTEDEAQYVRRISVNPLVLVHAPTQAAISSHLLNTLACMNPSMMATLSMFKEAGLRHSSASSLGPVLPFGLDEGSPIKFDEEDEELEDLLGPKSSGLFHAGEDNRVDEVEYA